MNSPDCNSSVVSFCTKNHELQTPPESLTRSESSKFPVSPLSSVLLETAISIASAGVRHARNQSEYEAAIAYLGDLQKQRMPVAFSDDVRVQDAIDVAIDAKRTHGGLTLDQFLAGGQ